METKLKHTWQPAGSSIQFEEKQERTQHMQRKQNKERIEHSLIQILTNLVELSCSSSCKNQNKGSYHK